MSEIRDGYAFLEELRQKNQKQHQSFNDFSKYLERKAREQGVPLNGQFELTPLCNFDCKMCYVKLTGKQMNQSLLSVDQWKDLMTQACRFGMLHATLTGGECLTYPGFKELFEHLEGLGCDVTVMTNGALLDKDWIAYFLHHRPAEILITLYGNSEDAYERVTGQRAFEAVVSHINSLLEAEFRLSISVTPNRFLGSDVLDTMRLAKSLCPSMRVNGSLTPPRPETGRTDLPIDVDEDAYIQIYRLRNELNGYDTKTCPVENLPPPGGPCKEGIVHGLECGGGRSGFSINWRGEMNPCDNLDMVKVYPLRDGFENAWRAIKQAVSEWPRPMVCQDCPYASVCEQCAGILLQYSPPGICSPALCERTKRFVQQGAFQISGCE